MNTRLAKTDDIDIIMAMIEDGRKHIQTYNIPQWINGYPSKDLILEDIKSGIGYVLMDNDEIVGYYVKIDYDPCYDKIDGSWINNEPYVAIHRTVTKYFNKGLGSRMFDEIKKEYDHIRVDTHDGNISMNKCLLKNSFKYCGVIYLKDGSPRNAYEYVK